MVPSASHPLLSCAGGFAALFADLVPRALLAKDSGLGLPRGGGAPKLCAWQWLMGRVWHALAGTGTFATHMKQITGIDISESALSQRAQSLGWELLAEVLPAALEPLAQASRHPDAFYQGLRLLAVDGVRFNLRNTAALRAGARKVPCSRGSGEPAFAQMLAVVLLEAGMHQPLGASLGWEGEGELTLTRTLFAHARIPERSLLLGDRLFGSPWLLHQLQPALGAQASHWLMRVKSNLKVQRQQALCDGSWRVEIPVSDPATRRKLPALQAREIHAQIHYEGSATPLVLRLWTSLLDEQQHPAAQLAELYAMRWEQELFFRELKSHLQKGADLLEAGTPVSAAQEVLALLLAAALVARQRAEVAAQANVAVRRVSFAQVLEATEALCRVFELGRDLIGAHQRTEWTRRLLAQLAQTALLPARRNRSCQRALRTPVKDWPKIHHPTSKRRTPRIFIANP